MLDVIDRTTDDKRHDDFGQVIEHNGDGTLGELLPVALEIGCERLQTAEGHDVLQCCRACSCSMSTEEPVAA